MVSIYSKITWFLRYLVCVCLFVYLKSVEYIIGGIIFSKLIPDSTFQISELTSRDIQRYHHIKFEQSNQYSKYFGLLIGGHGDTSVQGRGSHKNIYHLNISICFIQNGTRLNPLPRDDPTKCPIRVHLRLDFLTKPILTPRNFA